MKKQIETKKKRHEIYAWIEEHIGTIPKGKKGFLKELLVEYVKLHNEKLVQLNNELFEAVNEKSRLLDIERCKNARNRHNQKTHLNTKPLILE